MIPVDQLKKLKIFHEAPISALEILARDMVSKKFEKSQAICREGDKGVALYIIASGSVTVEKKLFQEGTESSKVVARLASEEFFGEMAFLENKPHSATVLAQETTEIFSLTRDSLDAMIKKEPQAALQQVLTILTGLSDRLRSTTRELISVFEVARLLGEAPLANEIGKKVVHQLFSDLAHGVTIGFYRWNPFNDEYSFISAEGPAKSQLPAVIEGETPLMKGMGKNFVSVEDIQGKADFSPLHFTKGHLILSRIDVMKSREGFMLYYSEIPHSFSSGEKQMMETVSAVLAPALATARMREEEESRLRLQRSKQEGSYM
jgi:CRP-like cAMP-binding protein